jgi:hypothetical protein
MNTIEDVQRILGRSRRQVRERLDALASADHLLAGQVVTGPHGRKEYAPAVLDMLRDLDMLAAQDAITLRQAAGQLAAKIHGSAVGDSASGRPSDNGNRVHLDGQAAEALRSEVDVLREENRRLWSQVDRLTDLLGAAQAQLALPAPRRRPWLSRLFRPLPV